MTVSEQLSALPDVILPDARTPEMSGQIYKKLKVVMQAGHGYVSPTNQIAHWAG